MKHQRFYDVDSDTERCAIHDTVWPCEPDATPYPWKDYERPYAPELWLADMGFRVQEMCEELVTTQRAMNMVIIDLAGMGISRDHLSKLSGFSVDVIAGIVEGPVQDG